MFMNERIGNNLCPSILKVIIWSNVRSSGRLSQNLALCVFLLINGNKYVPVYYNYGKVQITHTRTRTHANFVNQSYGTSPKCN